MSFGEVVECGHCNGSGNCCCQSCYKSAGIEWDTYTIQCVACGGVGKIWVGPKVVHIHNNDDDEEED